jgi:hypothetical protein
MSEPGQRQPSQDSQRPAGVPTGGGGKGLIVLGVLLLLVGGGLAFWKVQNQKEPEVPERTVVPAQEEEPKTEALAVPPPPPPPEEEESPLKTEVAPPKPGTAKVATGCSSPCGGTETAALLSALSAKAGQARTCYNRALRVNAGLEGKIRMAVRVSPSGGVCSATVAEDSLHDAGVSSCVTQMFKSASFPAPQSGCVDVNIPINFVSQK